MSAIADPTDGHLDELALDALRTGEGNPENAVHAESCPRCRASLAGLSLLESQLKGAQPSIPQVPPQLEARIFRGYRDLVAKPAPAPFPALLRRWTLPVAGLTAAAAAVTLTLRLAPPDEPVEKALRIAAPAAHRETSAQSGGLALAPVPASAPARGFEAPQAAVGVDIVDAFRLARALRDGRQVASGWDADGNGEVNGADVQAIARRAVAL